MDTSHTLGNSAAGTRSSAATALHFCSSRLTRSSDHSGLLNRLFSPSHTWTVSCRREKRRPFAVSVVFIKMSGAYASTSVKARNSLISSGLCVFAPILPPVNTRTPCCVSIFRIRLKLASAEDSFLYQFVLSARASRIRCAILVAESWRLQLPTRGRASDCSRLRSSLIQS